MDGGWRTPRVALVLVASMLVVPASAAAATAPEIIAGPVIDGTAQDGSVLTARAEWKGDPAPVPAWNWLRCARPSGSCAAIDGATAPTYAVTAADVGSVLRVRLSLTSSAGSDVKRSAATAVVTAAPTVTPTPTPDPTPTATASPTPAPAAEPQPTFDVPASPAPAAPVLTRPAATAPRMLSPFPVVRIKGLLIGAGARVTSLTVKAPRGVRISVTCRGRDCPVRWFVAPAGVRRLRRFERDFAAGTRLQVVVSKPGFIGKSTVIVIRRSAGPRRVDRCLPPGATRPVRCPAA